MMDYAAIELSEPFVTAAQAAAALGVSGQWVRVLLSRGVLVGDRVGRNHVVLTSSLQRELEARQAEREAEQLAEANGAV